MSEDFGFDSDPFNVAKSGGDFFSGSSNKSQSTSSTADSSRSGESRRGKLTRNRSMDDDGFTAKTSFPDPSFSGEGAEGGALAAATQRASRSRRRASIATSSTAEASKTETNPPAEPEFGNFDAPAFDEPSFEAPVAAPPARRPGRARRASVVGGGTMSSSNPDAMTRSAGSSRSIDTGGGMEAPSRTNRSSRNLGGRSNPSAEGAGPSNPDAAAAAPAPRRRTNRRASIASSATPEMAPTPEIVNEPATDYGYGEEPEQEAAEDYGYGEDSAPSGFGGGGGAAGGGAPRSRRMSCMNTAGPNHNSSDPFANLKSNGGGGYADGGMASTSTATTSKPSLGSGSSRQLNIMLPMTAAGPEKPKEPVAARPSRRRASMLGMVGNLTGGGGGGGGGADKLDDDDESKKGVKKGFFKDRKSEAKAPEAAAPKQARNRRSEGGLLDRLDATAPSSRDVGRSQGVSYSDRIMKN
jgi:hypothetical protein